MIDPTPIRRPEYEARELPPMPVENLGRLSAEAVLADYNVAAKSVESMGEDVKARCALLEAALVECDQDMKLIAEGAAAIREKGKLVSLQIEQAALQCKDVRDIVNRIKTRLGAGSDVASSG